MMYCQRCQNHFNAEDGVCPICGGELIPDTQQLQQTQVNYEPINQPIQQVDPQSIQQQTMQNNVQQPAFQQQRVQLQETGRSLSVGSRWDLYKLDNVAATNAVLIAGLYFLMLLMSIVIYSGGLHIEFIKSEMIFNEYASFATFLPYIEGLVLIAAAVDWRTKKSLAALLFPIIFRYVIDFYEMASIEGYVPGWDLALTTLLLIGVLYMWKASSSFEDATLLYLSLIAAVVAGAVYLISIANVFEGGISYFSISGFIRVISPYLVYAFIGESIKNARVG